MKRHVILCFALFICFIAYSQEDQQALEWQISKDIRQNELKVNLATTIFGSYPEISYERIINEDFSVGASLGVGLDDEMYSLGFGFIPYARWFFGGNAKNLQKYGAGFFIEANIALLSQNINYDGINGELGAGAGIAIGWKYLSRNNWVGELNFGAGRDFSNDFAYARFGISIGKRF